MPETMKAVSAHRDALLACMASLKDCHTRTLTAGLTPAACAAEWGTRNRPELCAEVLTAIISRKAWDGRIDSDLKDWAASNAPPDSAAARRVVYESNSIHPAHINQIARSFRDLFRI